MTTAPAASRHAHEQHTQALGYADNKAADHLARLSKIEGQIRGISRMVTGDRYCIDVLTQITAASRALQEVALSLLDDHVRGCVTGAARTDPAQAEEKFAELCDTLRRAVRL
ncbi:metal-sensitive transcriptional regulator [Streptomyces cinnabarinus]|uniref:Metal-sensitive transcriptional regulator n=1 Tax=Streptomyces cinnabarinus TaxID=67287 RepID=A0ABY7KQ11_9ACTN|nr:metal-sensitive transcriptional regulator [Streptomyces cinnabarinus]WAZ26657.1 metal-sensitive transcriptional regulator [Streptomyces cinnabarinus]